MTETFGIDTRIHPEWYFEGEDKYIDATLLFGVRLAEAGYDVKYMHGPVGLFEDVILAAVSTVIPPDETPFEYFTKTHAPDYIYFLYQVRPQRIRYARVSNIDWEDISAKAKARRKEEEPAT